MTFVNRGSNFSSYINKMSLFNDLDPCILMYKLLEYTLSYHILNIFLLFQKNIKRKPYVYLKTKHPYTLLFKNPNLKSFSIWISRDFYEN